MPRLEGDDIAQLVYLGALAIFIASGIVASRRSVSRDIKAFAFWMAALAALVTIYGFKDDAKAVWQRFAGTLVPGTAMEIGGEIAVARNAGGMFVVAGTANGADLRFLFDTGASAVVLSAADAARAGITVRDSDFSITTQTANGTSSAAPVVLDSVSIGAIRRDHVKALVARPGALDQSLLGHTFLDRLASYEVRGDRLILRDR